VVGRARTGQRSTIGRPTRRRGIPSAPAAFGMHVTTLATTVPLSVLDLSPIPSGRPASSALHDTVALARAAESFGYQRYWLAEHHNIGSVASSAPMVMIATVAAATRTIRVGSGGIMLPNHAPLAVAESFRVLEGLHPGRIDLGVGRAPGTDQLTAYALRRNRVDAGGDEFPQQFSELLAYVDGFPDDHPFKPLRAIPDDVPLPPLWILGSSLYGGQAAAAFGTGFAFAGHFGSADPQEAVAGYRENFEPSTRLTEPRVILGVAAIASESAERAEALARANDLAMVRLMQNRPGPVPTPEEAAAHDWTEQELALAAQRRRFISVGTPDQVRDDLERRRTYAGADELIVTTQVHDAAERALSYELLAKAYA
jgi:luciferase family oxidoreductase group 1